MNTGRISNPAQAAYLRRYALTEGKEAGLRIVEVNNGVLRFLLCENKALDMLQLWHKGENVGFLSKNGFSAQNIPFSRRFEGGMLYTCGLDSVGAREGYELHGTLHNTPAKILCTACGDCTIEVVAETEDTALFGKNLRFVRRVRTEIGSDTVEITDTLTNRDTREADFCLLYHVNLGYPFLQAGAKISSKTETVVFRTSWAEQHAAWQTAMPDNMDHCEEACFFLRHKTPEVRVENGAKKAFTLVYSETLPCFVQWCSPASGDYALGLEPCTTWLDDKFSYSKLDAGEQRVFTLKLSVSQKK